MDYIILFTIIGATLWLRSTIKHYGERLIMMDKTLAAQLDAATNAIATRFQALQDALKAGASSDGLTPAEAQALSDSLTTDIAKLNALGADPSNPIPATT